MGRNITLDQALQAKEQWPTGKPIMAPNSWVVIFPQFVNPNPSVIGDVRFRRALMYALDRQQMVDTIQAGVTDVAHSFISPRSPDHDAVQSSEVRYDFDPRQSARLIEELGYTRGSDGFYVDGSGRKITTEIWASGESKIMVATADSWRKAGVDA